MLTIIFYYSRTKRAQNEVIELDEVTELNEAEELDEEQNSMK